MNCPRCQGSTLEERERDGITIDACRTCRGLWLDRGELEKLIARAAHDFDDPIAQRDQPPPHGAAYRRADSEDDDDNRYRRDPQKKRGWFESLGDLF
jgi:uncharacterized protein